MRVSVCIVDVLQLVRGALVWHAAECVVPPLRVAGAVSDRRRRPAGVSSTALASPVLTSRQAMADLLLYACAGALSAATVSTAVYAALVQVQGSNAGTRAAI